MSTLYSLRGDLPAPLPFEIVMPEMVIDGVLRYVDGFIRTNPETFEAWEIAAAGYVEAPAMPAVQDGQQTQWNGAGWDVVDLPVMTEATRQASGLA